MGKQPIIRLKVFAVAAAMEIVQKLGDITGVRKMLRKLELLLRLQCIKIKERKL